MARAYTVYCNSETTRWQDALNQALPAGRLNFILGESLTLTLIVRDDDGAVVDLTGNTTGWNLALKDPEDLDGTTLLATKAGVVTDATAGTLTFTMTANDLNSTALATYLADPLGAPGYGKPVAVEAYTLPGSDKTVYASGTGTAQRSAYRTGDPADLNQVTLRPAFGTGVDGALIYTAAAGWTLAGATMSTLASNWTVSGATLTLLRTLNCTSGSLASGAILQAGADNTGLWPVLNFTGTCTVASGATIKAHLVGVDAIGLVTSSPGAARTTTGTGNAPGLGSLSVMSQAPAGGSGAGGGTATAVGGSRHAPSANYFVWAIRIAGGTTTAGTTGAGASGTSLTTMTYSGNPDALMLLPGMPGAGGGSGGATLGTGTATSGAGGAGGRGGGILIINAYGLTNAGTISADGEAGSNGSAATTTGNAQAGGGGGGSGGGGGLVLIRYGAGGYANTGTVTAARGAAGTGGAGSDSGGVSASYNGGNGGTSSAGIVATAKIA